MTAPPKVHAGRREWVGLAVLAVPTLLLAVDNSVLFLALPEIGADLGPSSSQPLWIMDSYSFMMAGFLITMGTLGDRIGRRRLLLVGALAFGIASAAAASAPTPELLIAARAAMGVAGAMVMPSTLALITDMFTEARQRGLAIAVWSSCFSAGAALGPVIGGVLLDWFWWGAVFLMGVLVPAAVAMIAGAMAAPLLTRRFRPGLVVAAALAVSTAGYLLLMLTEPDGGLAVPMIGFSLGMLGVGVVGTLGIELLVGSAPAGRAGSASSVAETGGELGVALGVAAFGSLATAVQVASGESADEAFTNGFVAVAGASGLLAAGLAVLAVALLRHVRPNE